MCKFIEVTYATGLKGMVNTEGIVMIDTADECRATKHKLGGNYPYKANAIMTMGQDTQQYTALYVVETYDQIKAMLM